LTLGVGATVESSWAEVGRERAISADMVEGGVKYRLSYHQSFYKSNAVVRHARQRAASVRSGSMAGAVTAVDSRRTNKYKTRVGL
jgi:hypothetical protein